MVFVNRGLVYWIKSLGATVNSGWNLMGNDLEQIGLLLKRYEFNKKYEMENIINVKTFCFDLLNNLVAFPRLLAGEGLKNKGFLLLKTAVERFLEEEEKMREDTVKSLHEKAQKKFRLEANDGLNVIDF